MTVKWGSDMQAIQNRRNILGSAGAAPTARQVLAGVAFALLAASGAQAGCKLTSFEMPVTMDGERPLVAVKIDGAPVKLVLDSAAFFSALDTKFIAVRKLSVPTYTPSGSHIDRATGVVRATLELGGATFPNMEFITVQGLSEAAGLLGQNVLHGSDNEYDLRNGVARLVKPTDCGSADLAYWVKPGMSYSVIPLDATARENPHTVATITVNGQKMQAFFDTAARVSYITARAAARAGVKPTDPGARPGAGMRGSDGQEIKTWVVPFADIKIGDEEIKNTQLTIGDLQTADFDVLIGNDFFVAHRIYVANSQGKIYFSYVGGPVFGVAVREEPRS